MGRKKFNWEEVIKVRSLDGVNTVQNIASEYGVLPSNLIRIVKKNNRAIQYYSIIGVNGKSCIAGLDRETTRFIEEYFSARNRKRELKIEQAEQTERNRNRIILPKNLEELKRKHPLVKDERFFCEWYFPEVN